jgi:hypothetical protein
MRNLTICLRRLRREEFSITFPGRHKDRTVSLRNERELIASRETLWQLERTVAELKALDPRSRATELSI